MTEYCEIYGEELDSEKEAEGICENCKISRENNEYKEDEDYVDPGII